MKKRITFIINPISGGKEKKNIPQLIDRIIDKEKYEIKCLVTRSEEETLAFAKEACEQEADAIVAVGGDGTLNNIARFLVGSKSKLGIVPMGSGNGFARELNIPMNPSKALQLINDFQFQTVDTGTINGHTFINVCGVGFDAHITQLFAGSTTRGLKTYATITLKELASYQPENYELIVDGRSEMISPFMLVICNGTQFGNNAYIAPQARFDDQIFNITAIKTFSWLKAAGLGLDIFRKRIHQSKEALCFAGTNIQIKRQKKGMVNIDGEPVFMSENLDIQMKPLSLHVITPKS